jgi:hypothetical protein
LQYLFCQWFALAAADAQVQPALQAVDADGALLGGLTNLPVGHFVAYADVHERAPKRDLLISNDMNDNGSQYQMIWFTHSLCKADGTGLWQLPLGAIPALHLTC